MPLYWTSDNPVLPPAPEGWITSGPVRGALSQPVLVNLAASAGQVWKKRQPFFQSLAVAAAPQYEQVQALMQRVPAGREGLVRVLDDSLNILEETLNTNFGVMANFVARNLAEALATPRAESGVLLWRPDRWDIDSQPCAEFLLREASQTALLAVVVGDRRTLADRRFRSYFDAAEKLATRDFDRISTKGERVLEYLAVCPEGLPSNVLRAVASGTVPEWLTSVTTPGPDGDCWYVPPEGLRLQEARDNPEHKCRLHGDLARAWPLGGWGYLRAGIHAVQSQDPELVLRLLPACVLGLAPTGTGLIYRLLSSISREPAYCEILAGVRPRIHFFLARLALSLKRPLRLEVARGFSRRGLACSHSADDRVLAMVEYANICASERRESGLSRADTLCGEAIQLLRRVKRGPMRVRFLIRILNIRALVQYRRRELPRAIRLEKRALAYARRSASKYEDLNAWATPLIRRNLAAVWEQLGNRSEASALLEENLGARISPDAREADLNHLARICFDAGDDERVVELLAPRLERSAAILDSPDTDLQVRCLFAVSLYRLDLYDRLQRQMKVLAEVNKWTDAQGCQTLLKFFQKTLVAKGLATEDAAC